MLTTTSNTLSNLHHDLDQTKRFLKALDPSASRFTFQFLWDDKARRDSNEPLPSNLGRNVQDFKADELCSAIANWNSAACPVGCFVTVNETGLNGSRKAKDIRRVRAVFVDIDEELARVEAALKVFPLVPSAVIESSPGKAQAYWFVQGAFPLDQFKPFQEALIKHFGTDRSVNDLPRVMRLTYEHGTHSRQPKGGIARS